MTTLERWLSAAAIALLVGLWHAVAARMSGPKSGPAPSNHSELSHRKRLRIRWNRRATLTRGTA
ncbi:MAG: hypothetical protein K2X87_25910 [Gemmataceae bacterium]|nr:hypothetical protein [Gemmataceae bacterium]